MNLLAAYRRTGADPPFRSPGGAHGVAMEGYYWRLVDHQRGHVVVVLFGACRGGGRRWGLAALAAHPGSAVREAVVEAPSLDPAVLRVRAGGTFEGSEHHVRAHLGEDAWVEAHFDTPPATRRVLGALGPAHLVPWLTQYWHPHVLGAPVRGRARVGGRTFDLDGASAYVEKNWGGAFPADWWWGQADGFDGSDAVVAFAGGPILGVPMSALAVSVAGRRVDLAPPLALVRGDGWRLQGRSASWAVEVEGTAQGEPHVLPVPDPGRGSIEPRSHQHLAARIGLRVTRHGSVLVDAESRLAGLERAVSPAAPAGSPR